eukprot:GHVN01105606.1.p1 GENE.GHVN01105606.1~~GHVN01105606.1.p1  ORF type:complete len:365 (+),score=73.36 GHVN01105606.1:141-1235(+)
MGWPSLPDIPKFRTGMSNVDLSLTNEFKDMNQLLARCQTIEKDCLGGKTKKDEIGEIEDDFLQTKALLQTSIHEAKDLIRQRHEIQRKSGNNVATIQKKAAIIDILKAANVDFIKLQDIYKKQAKQKKKFGVEELNNRFQDVQVLKRQIAEVEDVARNVNQYSTTEIRTLADLRAETANRSGGRFGPTGAPSYEEASEEDRATIGRWKERDKEFDAQLDTIGEGVERLGEIAIQIGQKAEEQQEYVTQLHTEADVATDELVKINAKIKKIMGDGNAGFNCCCKLILAIILIALIGFAITLTTKKIDGSLNNPSDDDQVSADTNEADIRNLIDSISPNDSSSTLDYASVISHYSSLRHTSPLHPR